MVARRDAGIDQRAGAGVRGLPPPSRSGSGCRCRARLCVHYRANVGNAAASAGWLARAARLVNEFVGSCARAAEFGRAVEWIQAADRFTKGYGCPFLFVYCRALYGGVLIASGDWVQAEEELQIAVAESKQSQAAVHTAALATLATLRLAQGRLDEAERLIGGIEEQSVAVQAGLYLARGAPAAAAAVTRALESRSANQLDAPGLVELLGEAEISTALCKPQDSRASRRKHPFKARFA
jgi:hypothetical protein